MLLCFIRMFALALLVLATQVADGYAQAPAPPTVLPVPPQANPVPIPGAGVASDGTAQNLPAARSLGRNTVRVKDITYIDGDRVNHVSGTGLVFGLSGTGGRAEQTRLMTTNYYLRKGIKVGTVDTQNISAVMVSGKIPASARKGDTILVTVSVADDATSLRGGTLSQTALRGIDDEIYAIAQGPILGGGVSAQGDAGSVQKNHPTVGVCEAIVEREIHCDRDTRSGKLRWILRNKSYDTATLIANAFNTVFPGHASALDSGTIEMKIPKTFASKVPAFISMMGDLRVKPDVPARVIVNQKTGTIVFGSHVTISPVVFASENIVIATSETPVASQPAPLSGGRTAVLPRTTIDITESGGTYNLVPEGLSVGDLANAMNTLGVAPSTLINVLTALRNQGSLQAELIIE